MKVETMEIHELAKKENVSQRKRSQLPEEFYISEECVEPIVWISPLMMSAISFPMTLHWLEVD